MAKVMGIKTLHLSSIKHGKQFSRVANPFQSASTSHRCRGGHFPEGLNPMDASVGTTDNSLFYDVMVHTFTSNDNIMILNE